MLAPPTNLSPTTTTIHAGADDGGVRLFDLRERQAPTPELQDRRSLVVDQAAEARAAGSRAIGAGHAQINAIAVDPLRPHAFATGGNDALVRLYDLRRLPPAGAAAGGGGTRGGGRLGGPGHPRRSLGPWSLAGPELVVRAAGDAHDLFRHPVRDGEDAVARLHLAAPTGGVEFLAGVVGQ